MYIVIFLYISNQVVQCLFYWDSLSLIAALVSEGQIYVVLLAGGPYQIL